MSPIYVSGDLFREDEIVAPDHRLLLHFEDYKRYCDTRGKKITDEKLLTLGYTKQKIAWLKFHNKL